MTNEHKHGSHAKGSGGAGHQVGHHGGHPLDSHGHAGHHHGFAGIDQWVARLDRPERAEKQMPDQVIGMLALQAGDVVADVGAGTGYFALRIAERYPAVRVVAVDAEPEMVAYLGRQARSRELANLEPAVIDPVHPLLPSVVNLALIVDTLHHVPNRIAYLGALKERMVQGARVAIIDYAVDAVEGPPADHRIAAEHVVDDMKLIGYKLVHDLTFLPNQYFLIFEEA